MLGAAQPCRRVGARCSEHPGRWIQRVGRFAECCGWNNSRMVKEDRPAASGLMMADWLPGLQVGRPRPLGRNRLRSASRSVADRHHQFPWRGAAGSRPPPTALRDNRTPPAGHNQDPGRGAEPGGADQRDEGQLAPRSRRAAVLVSSRDTRQLSTARLSHGLIRAAPVAGHPSRCDEYCRAIGSMAGSSGDSPVSPTAERIEQRLP